MTAQISVRERLRVTRAEAHMLDERVRTGEADARVRLQKHTRQVPDVITEQSD